MAGTPTPVSSQSIETNEMFYTVHWGAARVLLSFLCLVMQLSVHFVSLQLPVQGRDWAFTHRVWLPIQCTLTEGNWCPDGDSASGMVKLDVITC